MSEPRVLHTHHVLAVRDLARSTAYFRDVLGFVLDPVDAPGWSFLSRGAARVMLGECRDALPAAELGDHAYFAYVEVAGVDALHDQLASRGADVCSELASKPWRMREFGVRTPEGHRLMFGESLG